MSKFHMENVFIMDSYVLDMILNFFWRYLDRKGKIAKNLNLALFPLCSQFQRYNKFDQPWKAGGRVLRHLLVLSDFPFLAL